MKKLLSILLACSALPYSAYAMHSKKKSGGSSKQQRGAVQKPHDENPLTILLEQLGTVTRKDLTLPEPSDDPNELRAQFIALAARHHEVAQTVRMAQHGIELALRGQKRPDASHQQVLLHKSSPRDGALSE